MNINEQEMIQELLVVLEHTKETLEKASSEFNRLAVALNEIAELTKMPWSGTFVKEKIIEIIDALGELPE